ncbi:MAG: nucleotide sugar dehydrogenase [Thermoplasmata archaeon]
MNMLNKIEDRTAAICIIGLGYVGLPTAIFFAEKGFLVNGADIDEAKVSRINDGGPVFEELGITDRLGKVLKNKSLSATTDIRGAVAKSDIILVTVPTPITKNKEPDLGCVISASRSISAGLRKGHLVVLESTTYPGTTEEVMQPILEGTRLKAGIDFGLAYCPERYNPGDMEHTLDRVPRVVGGITPEWAEITRALYSTIIQEKVTVLRNIRTAEAAKIVENIQRDLNIALVNEFALIFDRMDIDVMEVLDAASTKWNFVKFKPGPGVGGHCLPVDPYYLTHKARELGYYPRLILAGRAINDQMAEHVVKLAVDGLNAAGKSVSGSRIAILGLAYKANTGDIRESPSERVIAHLAKMKADLALHDPLVSRGDCERHFSLPNLSITDALDDADCIIHMVNHDTTRPGISLNELTKIVKPGCVIVDTQYIFQPEETAGAGFIYRGIGRRSRDERP